MKRLMAILPLAALGGLVVVGFSRLTGGDPAPASFASPTRPAPQFDIPGFDGGQVKLADFAGRPVLINFWGSYCAPCKLEHPLLMEMQQQGVEIVGVLYKDPKPDEARAILARDGNPFTHIGVDRSGDLGIDIGISGVPESFLIDAKGQIVKTKRSYFVPSDVADYVAAFKAEAAKAGPAAGS